MKQIKVILSTGIGPLHLVKSAEYLVKLVDIRVIQSWIPKNTDGLFVKILSKLVGHKHLATGLKKRTPKILEGRNFSCAFPDFFLWGLNVISNKVGFPDKSKIAGWAWKLYGFQSKKYINNADIFHVRSGAGQGGAIIKAKKSGIKVIVDHSIAHPAYMDKHLTDEYKKNNCVFTLGMQSPLFQFTVKDANMADILLVNSEFVKSTFVENGYPPEKIRVVVQGVRDDFYKLKTDYTITNKVKLLFTGGFGFRKGGEYLLRALQMLETENFPFEMHVVGAYNEAKELIDKFPVSNITFHGFVPQDELKSFLSNCDIYVFPSLCEGCASSGMEALMAGMPVIATSESGFPILDKQEGVLIPSKNDLAIVNAIKQLVNDNILREYIGLNAAENIKTNYSWDKYAMSLVDIYNVMLKK